MAELQPLPLSSLDRSYVNRPDLSKPSGYRLVGDIIHVLSAMDILNKDVARIETIYGTLKLRIESIKRDPEIGFFVVGSIMNISTKKIFPNPLSKFRPKDQIEITLWLNKLYIASHTAS